MSQKLEEFLKSILELPYEDFVAHTRFLYNELSSQKITDLESFRDEYVSIAKKHLYIIEKVENKD